MTYHTHSIFGVLFTILIIKLLTILNIGELSYLLNGSLSNGVLWKFYAAAIVGSLLPDIDHAGSKTGRYFWFISKPLKLFGIKHRGFTHSIIGVLLFSFLTKELIAFNWISTISWYGLIIGYVSHLVADMLNVQGLPLLYPNQRRFNFNTKITTSSWAENLLFLIFFITTVILIIKERNLLDFKEIIIQLKLWL